MRDPERKRAGPGPPPLLCLLRPLAGPPHLQPHRMLLDVHGMHRLLTLAESGSAKSINPFIYNPFRPVSPPGTASAMLYLLANQAGVIDAGLLEGVAMARRLIWADHVQVKVKGGEQTVVPASEAGSVCWVCGEVAAVEVEIRNPTVIPIKVSHFRDGSPFRYITRASSPA